MSSKNISSATPYTVRVASLEDAKAIKEFGTKTFHDTFAEHNNLIDIQMYLEKTFALDQVRQEIADRATTFLLIFDGSDIIGYAKLKEGDAPSGLNEERSIEIERIYAHKDFIGKKVGQLLMDHCLEIARQRSYSTIWLGVWEHNPRAIAFYEKCGFEKFGSHPFLLGTDLQTDLLMKKKLK